MDSLMVCKTVTAPPTPGLWMNQNNGIKKAPSSLLVGSRINFPRQTARVLKINRTSRKAGGALAATCQGDKILVANRGEIAVRVIRTAHEMGIPCVAVYSTIDKDALHVKIADEAVCIGEAPSNQSYLVIPNVLSAAVSRGCTMLHRGYEFLSENAAFVEMCKEHGINFIGPNWTSAANNLGHNYKLKAAPLRKLKLSRKRETRAFFFNPSDEPIIKEAIKEPVAFMGGIFAGLLRLDLNEDPLKQWINRTVEASGITEQEIDTQGENTEAVTQQIDIE